MVIGRRPAGTCVSAGRFRFCGDPSDVSRVAVMETALNSAGMDALMLEYPIYVRQDTPEEARHIVGGP